jgi:mono/diheme cytochrome c family protein
MKVKQMCIQFSRQKGRRAEIGFLPLALISLLWFLAACQNVPPAEQPLEQQLAWGATVYRLECARCHDPERSAPELTAQNMLTYGNAHSLYEFNRMYMPLDKPSALREVDYWDVTAYILAEEGLLLLANETMLGPENAEAVNFMP